MDFHNRYYILCNFILCNFALCLACFSGCGGAPAALDDAATADAATADAATADAATADAVEASSAIDTASESGLDPAPQRLVVMTWNVEWMFDNYQGDNRSDLAREQSAPSSEYWKWKVEAVADAISQCDATIIALQEIEGEQTLADIAEVLREKYHRSYRSAFIPGSDRFTEQDVGILQRTGLAHYRRHEQSKAMFESERFYNVSKHLVAEFRWADVASPLTLMNMHLRAKEEAESERTRQARLARYWLEPQLDAQQDVIFLGDLNSEHTVGELAGEMQQLAAGGDVAQPPQLVDLLTHAPADQRRTHAILNKSFDRILVSPSLMADEPGRRDWVFTSVAVRPELVIRGQGNDGPAHWDGRLTMPLTELDVSDHYPVIATFELR